MQMCGHFEGFPLQWWRKKRFRNRCDRTILDILGLPSFPFKVILIPNRPYLINSSCKWEVGQSLALVVSIVFWQWVVAKMRKMILLDKYFVKWVETTNYSSDWSNRIPMSDFILTITVRCFFHEAHLCKILILFLYKPHLPHYLHYSPKCFKWIWERAVPVFSQGEADRSQVQKMLVEVWRASKQPQKSWHPGHWGRGDELPTCLVFFFWGGGWREDSKVWFTSNLWWNILVAAASGNRTKIGFQTVGVLRVIFREPIQRWSNVGDPPALNLWYFEALGPFTDQPTKNAKVYCWKVTRQHNMGKFGELFWKLSGCWNFGICLRLFVLRILPC